MDSLAVLSRGIKEYHAYLLLTGGKEHTVGFNAAKLSGLKVGDKHFLLAYKLVGSIEFSYTGNHLTTLKAKVYLKLKKLLCFRNGFALDDLGNAELNLRKVLDSDLGKALHLLLGLFCLSFSSTSCFNFLEKLLLMLRDEGEKATFRYIKKYLKENKDY